MSALQQMLRALADAYRRRDSRAFAASLVVSPAEGPSWIAIRRDIASVLMPSEDQLEAIFAPNPDARRALPTALVPFVHAILSYIAITQWRGDDAGVPKEESNAEWKAFDVAYGEASKIFSAHMDNAWIGRTLKKLTEVYLHLSFRAARIGRDSKKDAVANAMRRVSRNFQISAAAEHLLNPPDDGVPRRGDMVFALGNLCCKAYDQIPAHSLFNGVFTTYDNYVKPSIHARLFAPATTRADRVNFWYWRGKQSLGRGEVRKARDDLKMAFDDCSVNARKNLRAIFVRLAACQILLGHFPRPHLLAEFGVTDQFQPLIDAIKAGDRAAYYACFTRWSEWYRRRGIWLILREKGEVLLWRNLFRNTYKAYRSLDVTRLKNPRPSIPTSAFVKPAQLSWGPVGEEDQVDFTDVISMLSSLIDQSYIQGHISWKQTMLTLKPSADGKVAGFPPVATVTPRDPRLEQKPREVARVR